MNTEKHIKKRLHFLEEIGFLYQKNGEGKIYSEFSFKKDTINISLQFDYRNDFLDLTIKDDIKVLLKTSYHRIVVDNLGWETENFSQLLKNIYLQSVSHSLSQQQFIQLIDLYADFILHNMQKVMY